MTTIINNPLEYILLSCEKEKIKGKSPIILSNESSFKILLPDYLQGYDLPMSCKFYGYDWVVVPDDCKFVKIWEYTIVEKEFVEKMMNSYELEKHKHIQEVLKNIN